MSEDRWPNLLPKTYTQQDIPPVGLVLSIKPVETYYQKAYDTYIAAMRKTLMAAGLRPGVLGSYYIEPYRPAGTDFELRATPGVPVSVTIVAGLTPEVSAQSTTVTIMPDTWRMVVRLVVPMGDVFVFAVQGDQRASFYGAFTKLGSVISAAAQAAYDQVGSQAERLVSEVLSPMSSRLVEGSIPLAKLVPDVDTMQVVGTRSLVTAMIALPGTQEGVEYAASGLTANTAHYELTTVDYDHLVGEGYDRYADIALGHRINVWCFWSDVVRSWALTRLCVSVPGVLELKAANDRLVQVRQPEGPLSLHHFQTPGAGWSYRAEISAADFWMASSYVYALSYGSMKVGANAVHFDAGVEVDRCGAMGARYFDCDVDLDSDADLDYEEDTDPASLGRVGESLLQTPDVRAYVGPPKPVKHPNDSVFDWFFGFPAMLLTASTVEPPAVEGVELADWINLL